MRPSEQTEKEMLEWAGVTYEGNEIPLPLRRLIWIAQTQGKRIAWRDMYQIAAQQHYAYEVGSHPGGPAAKNSASAKP